MTVNKHGNRLPEKPAAHKAGHPYDNFIVIIYNKKKQRPIDTRQWRQTPAGQTETGKRLTATAQVTN